MTKAPININHIKAERCRRNFWLFVQEFWECADTSIPVFNWHMEVLANELQDIAYNIIYRTNRKEDAIINCPPGVSKSMIISVLFNAWVWTTKPWAKFITASYSNQVSIELSTKTRNLIRSDKYMSYYPNVRLKEDENNKTNFKTTYGGFRFCTSTGSNILGIHGDFIICDDIQNLDSLSSDVTRKSINDWVTGTLATRKTDKELSVMIFVQQRLGTKDLTGYLTSKPRVKFRRIVLPATLTDSVYPTELKDKYKDGLLDCNRLGHKVLEEIKDSIGTANYNAQFLQQPDNPEDSVIKRKWFRYEYMPTDAVNLPRFYFIDTAYGGDNSDYSAILECFLFEGKLYISNIIRVKEEFPDLIRTITSFVKAGNQNKVYIEGKASGKSIIQQLRSITSFNIIELQVKDNKLTRLVAIAPTVEGGRISLINGNWNEDFVSEICATNPINDDQRDVFTYAVDTLLIKNNNYGKYNIK
jgi:predicted phage terminase large subunit-like protein